MLKKEANVRVHQVLHLCLLLLVCAQCSSMWVTWLGSESSHHLTSILQSCNIPLSLSGFPSKRSRAPDLLHHFPSPSLCSALPANRAPWRRGPSHIPFILFVQGWMQAWSLLNAFIAWIHIRDGKLPFSWLGSSWGWGPPTLECLRSCEDCGKSSSIKETRWDQGLSGFPRFIALSSQGPWWSYEFKCLWK